MGCRKLLLSFAIFAALSARAELKRSGDGPSGGPDSDKITVVKTWDELRARPALNVGGVTIRLGIQAARSPHHSGVLIYCMADGYSVRWQAPDPDHQLGPVQFQVVQRDATKSLVEILKRETQLESAWPSGRLLFAQVIPIESANVFDVIVSDQKGKKLATCSIEGSAEAAHAWSPLQLPDELEKLLEEVDSIPERHLAYHGSGVALPKMDGQAPIRWESSDGSHGPQHFSTTDPLPALETDLIEIPPPLPELKAEIEGLAAQLADDDFEKREIATRKLVQIGKPALRILPALAKASNDTEVRSRIQTIVNGTNSGFSLRRVEDGFLISMKSAFQITLPEENFLARWWVNGKPFTPSKEESLRDISFSGSVTAGTTMKLRLDLDAAKLGAKSGDKIGVQFLYCPRGFMRMGKLREAMAILEDDSDKFPVLSNKVEFSAP